MLTRFHYCVICNGYTKHRASYKILKRCFYLECVTCGDKQFWFKAEDESSFIENLMYVRKLNKEMGV